MWFIRNWSANILFSYSGLSLAARDPVWEYSLIAGLSAVQKVMVPPWFQVLERQVPGFILSHCASRQRASLWSHLFSPSASAPPLQQPWLTAMPPGSAASIRPAGHVRGTKADCHHTQTKSTSGFLSAAPSWLSRLAWEQALRYIINVYSWVA